MRSEIQYKIKENILGTIRNYKGDKKSWSFISLVVVAYYRGQVTKMKMASYLDLNIGEVDYFLRVNKIALTDNDFSISASRKNFELSLVREMLEKIKIEYPKLHIGIEYHKEVDVWEIWHNEEKYNNDHEFCTFAGGLCKKAFEKGFFNFFIDYSYKKDMAIKNGENVESPYGTGITDKED